MEWIEHDEVPRSALPEWAKAEGRTLNGAPYRVRALPEGLVLERGKRASALRWVDILVPIRIDDPRRLLLAVARRPPRPPWFELQGADVAAIERATRVGLEALAQGGYRAQKPTRPSLRPDQVLTEVLE